MKKYIQNTIIASALLLTLTACGGGGGGGSGSSSTTSPSSTTITGELKYHDGVLTSGISPWGDGTATHIPKLGIYFDLANKTGKIKEVKLLMKNTTGSTKSFDVYLYKKNANSSIYDVEVSNALNQDINDTASTEKTIAVTPVSIDNEKVFVVVKWHEKPLTSANGSNSFFIGTDNSLDYSENYISVDGTTWNNFSTTPNGDAIVSIIFEN